MLIKIQNGREKTVKFGDYLKEYIRTYKSNQCSSTMVNRDRMIKMCIRDRAVADTNLNLAGNVLQLQTFANSLHDGKGGGIGEKLKLFSCLLYTSRCV